MSTRWFYSQAGQTHGPLSVEEIQSLASQGKIGASDLVWPEGAEQSQGTPAIAVLEIPEPATLEQPAADSSAVKAAVDALAADVPDWLGDVELFERRGPLPGLESCADIPDWLEDLRHWVALDLKEEVEERIPWDYSLGTPPVNQVISQAVEAWLIPGEPQHEEPKPAQRAPKSPKQPAKSPPVAKPVSKPPPAKPILGKTPMAQPPMAQPPMAQPPMAQPPLARPAQPASPAAAPPATAPQPLGPLPPPPDLRPIKSAAQIKAEETLRESGFDPRTGKIVDQDRFQKWKQEKAQAAPETAFSNASLFEVFRKARIAIENWLDNDRNRFLVLARDNNAIRNHPEIQALFRLYEDYGTVFRAKLLQHLEFMTENRSKYYKARPDG